MSDNHIGIQRGKSAYGYHSGSKEIEVLSYHRQADADIKKLLKYDHLVSQTIKQKNISMGSHGTLGYRNLEEAAKRLPQQLAGNMVYRIKDTAMKQLEGQESLEDIKKLGQSAKKAGKVLIGDIKTSYSLLKTAKDTTGDLLNKRKIYVRRKQANKKVIGELKRKKAKEKANAKLVKDRKAATTQGKNSELKIGDVSLKKKNQKNVITLSFKKSKGGSGRGITDKKKTFSSFAKRRQRLAVAARKDIHHNHRRATPVFKQRMLQYRKKRLMASKKKRLGERILKRLVQVILHMLLQAFKLALVIVLSLILLFAPVMIIVVVMYDCPLSLFLPLYETEDSEPDVEVKDVITELRSEFKDEVEELKRTHPGCNKGKIVYDGAEGMGASNNINDMVAAYMCRYGMLQNAAIINEETRGNMAVVVNDMCQYTTQVDIEIIEHKDSRGNVISSREVKTLVIHVTYKTIAQVKTEYGFNEEQCEFADMIMSGLGGLDLEELLKSKKPGDDKSGESLADTDIDHILDDIDDEQAKLALSFALDKVGSPYSQDLRDDGTHFDCSSLVYYAWKQAEVSLGYNGANTAAAEAQGLKMQDQTYQYDEEKLQPGDLIFWSYFSNGRYKDINHVAIYAGDGKIVQAIDEARGVQMTEIWDKGKIVMCGRPKK